MIRYLGGLSEALLLTLGALRLAFAPVQPRGWRRARSRRWSGEASDRSSAIGPAELADELARRVTAGRSAVSVLADLAMSTPGQGPVGSWSRHIGSRLASGESLATAVLTAPVDDDLELVSMALLSAHGDNDCLCSGLRAAAEVIRGREDVRRRSRAASAQAVLSARVMTSLPPVVLGATLMLSPGVRGAVASPGMVVVVIIGIALDLAGWRWMGVILSHRHRGGRVDPDHLEQVCLLVDLSSVAVRSGSTVREVIESLATIGPVTLRPRLVRVRDSLARGHRLAEALRELGSDQNATRLASVLVDGVADGSPLAPALDRLASDLRSEAARLNATRIGELPVRLTPPLVVCTLPSVALIAVAPVALAAMGSIRADL